VNQPVYNGKTLSAWVNELQSDGVGGRPELLTEAVEALRAIGERAVPFLLEWLLQPRVLERPPARIFGKARSLGPAAIPVAAVESMRWRHEFPAPGLIANAFEALGPKAISAIPELARALNDPDHPAWFWALDALCAFGAEAIRVLQSLAAKFEARPRHLGSIVDTFGNMGPHALPMLPFLIECGRNEDSSVRSSAVHALGRLRLRSDLVVPALVSALRDPELLVRLAAVNAISLHGKEAIPALPELGELANGSEQCVREAATRALIRIQQAGRDG
jgi:hypothetical protein